MLIKKSDYDDDDDDDDDEIITEPINIYATLTNLSPEYLVISNFTLM